MTEKKFNDLIKKMAIIQKNYYEKVINEAQLFVDFGTIKEKFLALLDNANIKEKKNFVIFMIILTEKLKNSLILEQTCFNILNREYKSFVETIRKILHCNNNEKTDKNYLNGRFHEHDSLHYNGNKLKKPQIKRSNFPKHISKMLKSWLRDNIESPYPSESEKQTLSEATGLDHTQINNWFINARRRLLPLLKNNKDY